MCAWRPNSPRIRQMIACAHGRYRNGDADQLMAIFTGQPRCRCRGWRCRVTMQGRVVRPARAGLPWFAGGGYDVVAPVRRWPSVWCGRAADAALPGGVLAECLLRPAGSGTRPVPGSEGRAMASVRSDRCIGVCVWSSAVTDALVRGSRRAARWRNAAPARSASAKLKPGRGGLAVAGWWGRP